MSRAPMLTGTIYYNVLTIKPLIAVAIIARLNKRSRKRICYENDF